MTSVTPVADRPTVHIEYAYDPTHTMATIAVERKPKRRSPLRRVLRVALIFLSGALAVFVAAGIAGTVMGHPDVPKPTPIVKYQS